MAQVKTRRGCACFLIPFREALSELLQGQRWDQARNTLFILKLGEKVLGNTVNGQVIIQFLVETVSHLAKSIQRGLSEWSALCLAKVLYIMCNKGCHNIGWRFKDFPFVLVAGNVFWNIRWI